MIVMIPLKSKMTGIKRSEQPRVIKLYSVKDLDENTKSSNCHAAVRQKINQDILNVKKQTLLTNIKD